MVERPLRMREVPGSMPGFSTIFFCLLIITWTQKAEAMKSFKNLTEIIQDILFCRNNEENIISYINLYVLDRGPQL